MRICEGDYTGQKFGRLSVNGPTARRYYWSCVCECGASREINIYSLLRGTSSCGCLLREKIAAVNYEHGMKKSPEYACWCRMNSRCYNRHAKNYQRYGGRGIRVCERWRHNFSAFYEDMGPRPSRHHSIDRINNEGPYAPENCRWATSREQSNNTRRNNWVEYQGQRFTIAQLARLVGVSTRLLQQRLVRDRRTVTEAIKPPR
jgi:hypothetical protein